MEGDECEGRKNNQDLLGEYFNSSKNRWFWFRLQRLQLRRILEVDLDFGDELDIGRELGVRDKKVLKIFLDCYF